MRCRVLWTSVQSDQSRHLYRGLARDERWTTGKERVRSAQRPANAAPSAAAGARHRMRTWLPRRRDHHARLNGIGRSGARARRRRGNRLDRVEARRTRNSCAWVGAQGAGAVLFGRAPARRDRSSLGALGDGIPRDRLLGGRGGGGPRRLRQRGGASGAQAPLATGYLRGGAGTIRPTG